MNEYIGLLCPQSCRLLCYGGSPGLNGMDIAHGLINSSKLGYLIIRCKYGGDHTVADIARITYNRLRDEMQKEDWPTEKTASLVMLAALEYTGTKVYTDKRRAQYLDVHPSTWSRAWKTRYNRVLEVLETVEQSTLYALKQRLRT